jgi:hypothetical protein
VLIIPTTVTADSTNFFDLQDVFGSFIKTRDANANFSIADFGGNVVDPSATNIFSYLSTGNSYDATTNIVVNFGSLGSYVNSVDTWNFGDNSVFDSATQSFNLGRGNSFTGTFDVSVFGNFNLIDTSNSVKVIGDSNVISGENDKYILGNNDNNLTVDGTNGNVYIGIRSGAAKLYVLGIDALTEVCLRLEPIAGTTEDTTGQQLTTVDGAGPPATNTLQTIPIPLNTVVLLESYVTCRKTAGAGLGAVGAGNAYVRTVKAQNIAGVVTIGVIQSSFTSEVVATNNATFDVLGTNVRLRVLGSINNTFNWNVITKNYPVD